MIDLIKLAYAFILQIKFFQYQIRVNYLRQKMVLI